MSATGLLDLVLVDGFAVSPYAQQASLALLGRSAVVTQVNPIRLTRFVAGVLLAATCIATAWYALMNARNDSPRLLMWRYIGLSTAVGAVFAALIVTEAIYTASGWSDVVTAFRRLSQLFFVIFLSLAMRELYYEQSTAGDKTHRLSLANARRLETGFMLLALVQFPVAALLGPTTVTLSIVVIAAAAFTAYGVSFARGIRERRLTSGTVLDVTVTYVIAVLLSVGTLSIVEGSYIIGVPEVAVDSAVNIFLIMSATFLISLIIRLKRNAEATQHVAG